MAIDPAAFKSYDLRGTVPDQLNPEMMYLVGRAFADYLPREGVVAVGRDMREDSGALADSLIAGLRQQGRDVWDLGLVTSDMIYFAVGEHDLAGGVVVTASHNPGAYNGAKFYRDGVVAVGLDSGLDQVRDMAIAGKFRDAEKEGTLEYKDITEAWVKHCLSFVDVELKPMKGAIDTGNGMAGAILPHILPKLPQLEVTEMYFEVDGSFPNHEANPQQLENLQDLIDTVTKNGLDLGIAFDGDGDRAVMVDGKGRPVSGSDFISLCARHYLNKYPGSEVVHEVRTSRACRELITEWGGKPFRTKAGRVSIGTVMRERGAPFGGETTGHLFFKENFFADSGLIAALVALAAITESGKPLADIVDEYHRYPMIPERNIEVEGDAKAILEKVADHYGGYEIDRLDGLTVEADDWWFNLRASNTEPVLRLNAEAKTPELLDETVRDVLRLV